MPGAKGRSGRPKKPTKLKVIQGTFRKDRANPNEPKPKEGIPAPSKYLKGGALEEFYRVAELVHGMQVLTEADVVALELLAQSLDEYRQAKAIVEKEGMTYIEQQELYDDQNDKVIIKTTIKANPAVAIASDAWKRSSSLLARFGLDPANRSRVSSTGEPPKGKNKWLLG